MTHLVTKLGSITRQSPSTPLVAHPPYRPFPSVPWAAGDGGGVIERVIDSLADIEQTSPQCIEI